MGFWARVVFSAALAIGPQASLAQSGMYDIPAELLTFSDLDGWAEDDHGAALEAFLVSCADIEGGDWPGLCALAHQQRDTPRSFFELFFRPVRVGDQAAFFTGYFEPLLRGARVRSGNYRHPIYRIPSEIIDQQRTRAEIEEGRLFEGQGLEIAWIDDPVEAYFLHIQGSGRVQMPDGSVIRVGYAGRNGHAYRSVGQELVRRGIYEPHQVSAQVIQSWVRRNPIAGQQLLRVNPSYIFFREVDIPDPELGPLGAMNRSITPLRTVAVDPRYTPLGAPVWVEKDGADPIRRLMIAQDTGGAIQGPQRADIFFGLGDEAGRAAGRIRDSGSMIVLLPIEDAHALAPDV